MIREVDGLRFFAILAVLTSHSWGSFATYSSAAKPDLLGLSNYIASQLFLQGKLGVFLFFISGFILTLPFAKVAISNAPRVSILNFYKRRLTRLEPPYVLCMLAYYFILSAMGRLSYQGDFDNLIASLLYSHNVIFGHGSTIYLAAWSLEVEFQFYVLVPVLLPLVFALKTVLRRIILIVAIIAGSLMPSLLSDWPDTILKYSHYFFTGILLADLYITRSRLFSEPNRAWDLVAFLAVILVLFSFERIDIAPTAQLSYCLGFGGLFIAACSAVYFRNFVRWTPIVLIGGMCYSIYLVHGRVMSFFSKYVMSDIELTGMYAIDHMIVNLFLIPIAILVSSIFFMLVERPTMDSRWPVQTLNWFRTVANKASWKVKTR